MSASAAAPAAAEGIAAPTHSAIISAFAAATCVSLAACTRAGSGMPSFAAAARAAAVAASRARCACSCQCLRT